MLDFYSQFNPSPLSIKQFLDFGELTAVPYCVKFNDAILKVDFCRVANKVRTSNQNSLKIIVTTSRLDGNVLSRLYCRQIHESRQS
jgi:hypothetical protein